jgi:hypothetical protein
MLCNVNGRTVQYHIYADKMPKSTGFQQFCGKEIERILLSLSMKPRLAACQRGWSAKLSVAAGIPTSTLSQEPEN